MPELKAKVWFGDDPIIQRKSKGIKIKEADEYFELEYKEKDYDSAFGEMHRKIKEVTEGKNPFGILIY